MNNVTQLPSNWQCHKQLFKIVWGISCCPDCGGKLLLRPSYEWCRVCRLKTSVKSETIFRNSNLSFQQIWLLIWCWQRKHSIGAIRSMTGLSYLTIRRTLRKLRQALPSDQTLLSGLIEADESAFGKQRFKVRGSQKWVVGAIEHGSRHVRLQILLNREREALEGFVRQTVMQGSHINTDAWHAYNELGLLGYTHDFCNHSQGHFGPTNHIENLWSVVKRHLRALYGQLAFSADDLSLILNEWQIRQNQPDVMYNVGGYLRVCGCSGLLQ